MIYSYGVTMRGSYHIKKEIVCQDAHSIVKCSEKLAVAAVADGLGSEAYTDMASRVAAQTSVAYCVAHISEDDDELHIASTIRDSFIKAQHAIEEEATKHGYPIDQCDTTLSLAILNNGVLYFGHAGDSGIIALTDDGRYVKVTEQQRDDEGRVFPLYFGEKMWKVGKFEGRVACIFLATDGMYETLFPVYLKDEPVKIYVALARYLIDPEVLNFEGRGEEAVQACMEAFLEKIPGEQVNDDKTIAVLCDTAVPITAQPEEYYKEPNWAELKRRYDEAWRRMAYPYLYETDEHNGTKQEEQTEPCDTED